MNPSPMRRAVLTCALLSPLAVLAAPAAPPADFWRQLEGSRWIGDGRADAPRIVYVFTDANCPYCAKFWSDARPWVDSGKVQLRHLLVGIITPTSPGKAAALLAVADPAAALAAHERGQVPEATATIASGNPQALRRGTLKPLDPIPPAIRAQIQANQKLMAALQIPGTPGVVWRDPTGRVHSVMGGRSDDFAEIFGPR